jgi:protoporphyrinogen oxidase
MTIEQHDQTSVRTEQCDVAILGAGVSGLSAAHQLAGRDVVVLEADARVGGRTLSGGDDNAWYNLGAQLVTSRRMASLAKEVGVELVSAGGAQFGFITGDRLAKGSSPERLLARMSLSKREKLDFAFASLRLRRKLHALATMSDEERVALDEQTLMDVIGRVSPKTLQLFGACCDSGSGMSLSSISGLYGLAYALGAYLDPAAKRELYGVRGGTQSVARAVAARLAPGVLRLGSRVTSVRQDADGVVVDYVGPTGAATLHARHCICSLPADHVMGVVEGLSAVKRTALRQVTSYATAISVAWPVADGVRAPWDDVFVAPATHLDGFNLMTNYGYLSKQLDPQIGGYLNTLASGERVTLLAQADDDEVLDLQEADLRRVFGNAVSLLDRGGAVVQRWQDRGLPRVRPGYLSRRAALREAAGRIVFCGDYTAEPGLPGANGSGHHAGAAIGRALDAPAPSSLPVR